MDSQFIQFTSPQFRLLPNEQVEKLHCASLEILERTGVTIDCEEAIMLLDSVSAGISD